MTRGCVNDVDCINAAQKVRGVALARDLPSETAYRNGLVGMEASGEDTSQLTSYQRQGAVLAGMLAAVVVLVQCTAAPPPRAATPSPLASTPSRSAAAPSPGSAPPSSAAATAQPVTAAGRRVRILTARGWRSAGHATTPASLAFERPWASPPAGRQLVPPTGCRAAGRCRLVAD